MSKRGNHEANIRFRKKEKRWEASLMVGYWPDGRRRRISVYGKTRKDVLEKMDQLKQDIDLGIDITNNQTFRDVANLWLAQHQVAASTHKHYQFLLKPILAEFGNCTIASILPHHLEAFLINLAASQHSDSYIRKIKSLLTMIFAKAKKNRWIRSNPASDLENIKSQVPKTPREHFTLEEMQKLHISMPYDLISDSIRLLMGTGIRLGELLAINKSSFSKDCDILHVQKAVKQIGGKISIGVPKSKASIRDIVIPEAFRPAAKRLLDLCADKDYLWEIGIPGQPCHESYFRKLFKRSVESILGPISKTPHAVRHGYATVLANSSNNISGKTIQCLLGHANQRVAEEVYIHPDAKNQQAAADALSNAFLQQT